MNDISNLRCHFIKDLRGSKSQSWLAQRLGVSKSQVHRWESGTSHVKWSVLNQICKIRRRSLSEAIINVTAEAKPNLSGENLIRFLTPRTMTIEKISKEIGCSRYTVSRWFNKKTKPDLDDVLTCFAVFKPMLLRNFLSPLVSENFMTEFNHLFQSSNQETDLTYEHPVIALILRCFELSEYIKSEKHLTGFISAKAGVPIEEEKKFLSLLENAGIIAYDGKKYRPLNPEIDIRGNFEGGRRVRQYWLKKAQRFIENQKAPTKNAMFGTNVFSISQEGYDKIRESYLKFFEETRSIISNDKKAPEIAAIMSIQIFDPSEEASLKPRMNGD